MHSSSVGEIAPGLYVTATPIGNLEDITLRALHVLRVCDRIVCEDTRVSTKLLDAYNIKKPLIVYHDRSADVVRHQIVAHLQNNEAIALISDAGTPLISDPGFKLVNECMLLNRKVTTLPGASAVLPAAILSGYATHAITFLGFASNLSSRDFELWRTSPTTLIFFEAPHKLVQELSNLRKFFKNRKVAVVREITKIHEEVIRGSFDEVLEHFLNKDPRGEIVIVLAPPESETLEPTDIDGDIALAMSTMSLKDSVALVAEMRGMSKGVVYKRAIALRNSIMPRKNNERGFQQDADIDE
ncbi:MAG: 16S rRNA (cytidine(1402)-2'-O)-methyltransferase [Holosporales bacterium]|jgi:16S rRNA (cytidine1402-2'-O)-methyltransferase|nr:16S rRNA (cytidine(1402)-2'-O)-methyltransferase [Holosporales bacterium]